MTSDATESNANISKELLELTQQAFSKSLARDTWRTLTRNYPEIEGTETPLEGTDNGYWKEGGYPEETWI